ncbi:hypothetical protein ACLESO_30580 [Pyxidicoccus sp. 3LG]
MKVLWCWRCKMDIPMLDDEEFERVAELFRGDPNAKPRPMDWVERHRRACEEYSRLTGFPETNINAVLHHRLSRHGPPCMTCGKPLRSPQARHCAACGAWRLRLVQDP